MGCATSQPVHDESTYARVAQKAAAADLTEPRSVRVFSGDSAEHTTGGSTGKTWQTSCNRSRLSSVLARGGALSVHRARPLTAEARRMYVIWWPTADE